MATETTPPPKPSPELPFAHAGTPTGAGPPPSSEAITPAHTPTPSTPSLTPATVAPRHPEPDAGVIHIPSYSRWFSWNSVHECEARFLPEFFDDRSPSKNPRVYKYFRNAIVRRFRENSSRKITFTDVRKALVGDVGSVRRVFDFLETWGLINYAGSARPQLKLEDKETKSAAQGCDAAAAGGADVSAPMKRVCNGCQIPCTIACFASDKHDVTLCVRCYVRGNYRVGLSSTDFKRVEISEEAKMEWTDKETLQLLEAVMHYEDDWKKVAEHVDGKTAKECVARFVKLPFGEEFYGPPESAEMDAELGSQNEGVAAKRMCLSPLADASNPIMAQAAFLSTLVGVDAAEMAACAAVMALSNLGDNIRQEAKDTSKLNLIEDAALVEAKSQLEKEGEELEKAISEIATQTKEIESKIREFEEFELEMERKRQEFQQIQNRLFVDRLTFSFQKTAAPKTGETIGVAIKID
ncbi:SWI/SNF complex subunit SMARCC2 [Striga asiatica]|uniref:SWI/SNF complex subunit SMARCC2 n=1 Tax=Striga asiatica TaxID=4170 RepID=A0A5A7PWC5_STRAF|nr:SWI/SNF complex subunit SMARCC2 [Striga asiatica]